MSKHVLFVCATGIATSTEVAEKVIAYCKERGLTFDYSQANVASVPAHEGKVDLIVATTKIPYQVSAPVVRGLPLITGIGEEQTLEKIYDILKE